jgi:hypothetical protein
MEAFLNSVVKYVIVLGGISCVTVGVILGIISQRRREQAQEWEEERKRKESLLAEQGQEAHDDKKIELWDNFEDD